MLAAGSSACIPSELLEVALCILHLIIEDYSVVFYS